MIVLATFLTSHFGEWRARWHNREGSNPEIASRLQSSIPFDNQGVMAAFDLETEEVLWSKLFDTPAGFVFTASNIYLASMYGNRVLELNRKCETTGVISNRMMNDLHSICKTDRGLMVASSGIDGLLEVAESGEELWCWLGTDHGYNRNRAGLLREIRRNQDYRLMAINTQEQTTHCNGCLWYRDVMAKEKILVTLFHQGEIIEIDYASGKVKVVCTGLSQPHAIRPRSGGGWSIANSADDSVVLLDREFWVEEIITGNFNWVQDAIELSPTQILLADANNNRLVRWDRKSSSIQQEINLSGEWKIYQVEIVPDEWVEAVSGIADEDMKSGGC